MTSNVYQKLREKLLKNKKWPLLYMYKFIVPNTEGKVDEVVSLLPKEGKINYKHTKSLTYVSVTCTAKMESADAIIKVLSEVSQISGVISL